MHAANTYTINRTANRDENLCGERQKTIAKTPVRLQTNCEEQHEAKLETLPRYSSEHIPLTL